MTPFVENPALLEALAARGEMHARRAPTHLVREARLAALPVPWWALRTRRRVNRLRHDCLWRAEEDRRRVRGVLAVLAAGRVVGEMAEGLGRLLRMAKGES